MFIKRSVIAILLLAATSPTIAQDSDETFVHWAYASFFGSGWYKVGDEKSVFALRYQPRWQRRESSLDASRRQFGIEFRLPVTVGFHRFDFDDPLSILEPDNFATVSVTPGIEIDIPITDRWNLKPLACLGGGKELGGDDSALIYWAGIKSEYLLPAKKLNWTLANTLSYAGYTPDEGRSSDFYALLTGLEFRHGIGSNNRQLNWHVAYTIYDDIDFPLGSIGSVTFTDEWEFGLAMSRADRNIKVWRFSLYRLGLAFRYADGGNVKGIKFVFRSIYDR